MNNFKGLLKWLFTKQQGDEDPLVIEDTEEPIIDEKIPQPPLEAVKEDPIKNVSLLPKDMEKNPIQKQEVVEVKEETKESIIENKIEIPPVVAVIESKPIENPMVNPPPKKPKKNYGDGFTSTGSLY